MTKNNNVPQIRFKGFTDTWEQRELGELSETTYSGGTPNTSNLEYWNGDIPWIQSSDIVEHQLYGIEPKKYITQTGLSKSATKLIPANSIAIVTRVGVGKLGVMPFSYTTSQDFLSLSNLNVDIDFGAYLIYKKIQSELNAVQGTSIKGVTKEELLKKKVLVPSKEEQRQIGTYFRNLDHLITLHQRKCETLKKLKKSMLQKMFPKNGKSVPEIRFAGFTDAWEQRKLEEICEQVKETVDPQLTPDTKFYEYSMPAFDDNSRADIVSGYDMNSIRKVINAPCLLINKLNVRKKRIWLVEKPEKNAVCSAEFVPVTSDVSDLSFLKYTTLKDDFTAYLEDCSSGSSNSQKRVTPDVIMKATIQIPTIAEQSIIGTFFSNLDSIITLHQRKLETLKKLKKSMLQKMFI